MTIIFIHRSESYTLQILRLRYLEKLVRKYYKTEEKQRRMLEMIHRKLDNLGKCADKREKNLVIDFLVSWEEKGNGI